jgi:uncharacterized delta-60 repeat protein
VGFVIHHGAAGGDGIDEGEAIAVDGQGRIIVAGSSSNGTDLDMVVWRYTEEGALDTDFNGTGIVTHDDAAGGDEDTDHAYAVAVDGDGRIVVAGSSEYGPSNNEMAIWRLTDDGGLDLSFNGVGYCVHRDAAAPGRQDWGFGVAVDNSGRIVVVGCSYNDIPNRDAVVWRYTNDGNLDESLNGTGFIVLDDIAGGNDDDCAMSVGIDPDNRIIVAGWSVSLTGTDMFVLRLLENGEMDTTFNGTGSVIHGGAAGANYDRADAVAFDASGRILAAGSSEGAGGISDMAFWRCTATGQLDTTLGGTGYLSHDGAAGGNDMDEGYGVTVDWTGRILVAGSSVNSSDNRDTTVWRYTDDGTLDSLFNGTGHVSHDSAAGGNGWDAGKAVTLDARGRILVAGRSDGLSSVHDMAIWRYR